MISRIRLDVYGKDADYCSRTMNDHANLIEEMLGVPVSKGEEVIERSIEEPIGSAFAYRGRLILHPDISGQLGPCCGPGEACTSQYCTGTPLTKDAKGSNI